MRDGDRPLCTAGVERRTTRRRVENRAREMVRSGRGSRVGREGTWQVCCSCKAHSSDGTATLQATEKANPKRLRYNRPLAIDSSSSRQYRAAPLSAAVGQGERSVPAGPSSVRSQVCGAHAVSPKSSASEPADPACSQRPAAVHRPYHCLGYTFTKAACSCPMVRNINNYGS